MPIDSRLKTIKIMNQRKAFYKQRIQESRCAWKETVNRDILIKFRNHPPKEGKEPVQSIQMSIYESNTYREDLCWLHFEVDPRVQERAANEGQAAYSIYASSSWKYQSRNGTSISLRSFDTFIEIKSNHNHSQNI